MSELDFTKDIAINERDLMRACLDHPDIYKRWTDAFALAKRRAKLKKHKLAVLKAKVSDVIRKNPSEYGITRITDKLIETHVTLDSDVIAAERALIDAEFEQDVLYHAVDAMQQKKDSLNNAVKLALSEWYSLPSQPKNLDDVADDVLRRKVSCVIRRTK